MSTALIAVLFLIIPCVCASCADCPSRASDLLSIFHAYKTGVLRVCQDDIDDEWLRYYQLLPTETSIDRISQLLLKDSAHRHGPSLCHAEKDPNSQNLFVSVFTTVLRYGLGCDTVKTPQNVLVVALRKAAGAKQYLTVDFLARYAVFKALLYRGLSREEASVLKSIFSDMPLSLKHLLRIGRLVDDLASPRRYADLLAALICSIDVSGLKEALSAFTDVRPEIIDELVKEHMESSRCNMVIPFNLFSRLPPKSQYELLRTKIVPWHYQCSVCWRSLCILSRHSESPSEEIQRLCLEKKYKYLVYEETIQQVKGNLLIKMDHFDPKRIPKDVWIKILLYCDNLLFQIYTAPLVCKAWKRLHHILLSQSSTVQEAFIDDWSGAPAFHQRCHPWNYFLTSPLALFTYFIVCIEGLRPRIDNQEIIEWVEAHWQQSVQWISKGENSMTSVSYLSLYVRCRKVLSHPLVFYQLPSISDQEYIALIRKCISLYKTTPMISERFLREDCGKFVQMLERDENLIVLPLQHGPWCHDGLSIYLFLTKPYIPPEVGRMLCETSKLYRLLTDESSSAEERLTAIFRCRDYDFDASRLARSISSFCLAGGTELEALRKNIWEHCFGQNQEEDPEDLELVTAMKRKLSLAILTLLCEHCQDYSEEEFCSIQRFLELCGILDQDSKAYAFSQYIGRLLNDPKITIELVC